MALQHHLSLMKLQSGLPLMLFSSYSLREFIQLRELDDIQNEVQGLLRVKFIQLITSFTKI